MRILEDPRFNECIEVAKDAKSQRKEIQELAKKAEETEKNAVLMFQELISETLKSLKEEEAELSVKHENLKCTEERLGKIFCAETGHDYCKTQIGYQKSEHHTFVGNLRSVYLCECRLCGMVKISEPFYHDLYSHYRRNIKPKFNYDREAIMKMVLESIEKLDENDAVPDWKETAEEFLKVYKQVSDITNELSNIKQNLEEICTLFGHDAECVDKENEVFRCKCCGKEMRYQEYIDAHFNATYRGGIVPYHYRDPNPILK